MVPPVFGLSTKLGAAFSGTEGVLDMRSTSTSNPGAMWEIDLVVLGLNGSAGDNGLTSKVPMRPGSARVYQYGKRKPDNLKQARKTDRPGCWEIERSRYPGLD